MSQVTDAPALNYESGNIEKPPLAGGIRARLSVMMFLEFAVWGSWFVVFGNYLNDTLHFTGTQVGSLYGTMALGAILSNLVAGQIADRFFPAQYMMAFCHLAGAVLLYLMATLHGYHALFAVSLAYALLYNPTLALSNQIAFANIPDATRDFPTLRVMGTIGWIVAASWMDWSTYLGVKFSIPLLDLGNIASTNKPLLTAAGFSAVLGVFSLVLPHTPPRGKQGDGIPFVRALKLLGDPSFGVFFGLSLAITIALAFYYGFAGQFLGAQGVTKIGSTLSLGQWSELGFMLLLPFALKRLGMKYVLGIGMAAWALRYFLFSIGHPFPLVLIGVIIHGVCFDFFLAAGFIYTDEKAPHEIRGSAQALFSFLVYGVGMWIGNLASGVLKDACTVNGIIDWGKFWRLPAIGAAVCLVLFLVIWRDRAERVAKV